MISFLTVKKINIPFFVIILLTTYIIKLNRKRDIFAFTRLMLS